MSEVVYSKGITPPLDIDSWSLGSPTLNISGSWKDVDSDSMVNRGGLYLRL